MEKTSASRATRNDKIENNAPEPKIKLKVIEMESGNESKCEPAEAKTWEWGDPGVIRIVNGAHVMSWPILAEIIRRQEEKGVAEVVVYEAPRFMLLGGG